MGVLELHRFAMRPPSARLLFICWESCHYVSIGGISFAILYLEPVPFMTCRAKLADLKTQIRTKEATSSWPFSIASSRAVFPVKVVRFLSAPMCSKRATISALPALAA